MPEPDLTRERTRREHRRVALGTLVGTTIEWYDFFIYANAAALVLTPMFFEPFVASYGELAGRLISFATVGVSFFFRPLGAMVAGHFGDKLGRKAMLVLTLMLMGASTTLIGLVPGYASIGIWAPILLIVLRILQGFSAGGEWGGAALMAVEHAPANRRGRYGGFPQIGVPVGMLIATAVLSVVTATTTEQQFLDWGWRVPFLLSVVLIAVGMVIRLGVAESPVFAGAEGEQGRVKLPLVQMFRFNGPQVLQGTLTFAANNAAGYMVTGGYLLSYTTTVLEMDRSTVLNLVSFTSAAWVVTTMASAMLSDRIGRTAVYKIGFAALIVWVFPMFWLIDTENVLLIGLAMLVFSIGIGFTYGPQAAMLAEMFPAQVRYSGAGLSYAFGAILGGAFAPMIATWLQAAFGSSMAVSGYLLALAVVGLIATYTIKDRTGKSLGADAFDIPGAAELSAAANR
ncbi:MFS transporter [Saccharopolyspora hirsuta]|uniref:MHS family MFS transporter n=1 Tax=Saccharopolyspora hirsuta TaxID=1837 RepID=A0A5M7BZA9_SACHI|nr:MFS transporter [Saccharopolyspora hirsuta]KAA5835119.1 MHS family MFS transporter [Saccharopolyspora hirsuta]